MITADQLKDVMDRADALHHYLNIDQKKVEFEEEQLRTQAPDFWEDPKYAQEQMKKVKVSRNGSTVIRLYVFMPMNCSLPSISIKTNGD